MENESERENKPKYIINDRPFFFFFFDTQCGMFSAQNMHELTIKQIIFNHNAKKKHSPPFICKSQ